MKKLTIIGLAAFLCLTSVAEGVNSLNAPTNFQAVRSSDFIGHDFTVMSWTDNSSREEGYNVLRAELSNGFWGDWQVISQLPANSQSFTDYAVSHGVFYRYAVQAFRKNKVSGLSEVVVVVFLP